MYLHGVSFQSVSSFGRAFFCRLVLAICTIGLAIALTGAHPASAQVLYGSIVGNVVDQNGSAIPGAAVIATKQNTGVADNKTTNGVGEYNFVTLQAGTFTIKVAVAGFKTFERRDLVVEANNITRTDVKLQVGSMEQSVTVSGEAPVLQTDRAETRANVTSVELENLPVPLGRNYQQLYRTLPGVAPPFNSHSIPTNPSRSLEFHVNGTSDDQNNTRIDGVSSTTVQLPHIVSYIPALESIQEVNVVTSSFDAEQGLAGGAAINVPIKTGTNKVHGSAFEYHSNQHLKAWPESVPPGQSEKPNLIYNQFGGTIGGPIKKDKLFYFVSYEGSSDHRNVQRKVTVPTDGSKAGDFSQCVANGIIMYNPYTDASGTTLADPSQRLPMMAPGDPRCDTATNPSCENIIPASLLNTPSAQIAQKINALWPEPNLPGLKNNYFASGGFAFDRHTIDTKMNWNINQKFNVFGRFSFLHYSDFTPTVFQSTGAQGRPIGGSSNPGHGHGETYSTTFGATYTFKPNFIMDAYFGFTKQGTNSEQTGLGKNIGLDVLGIPGTNGPRKFESGWPEFQLAGVSGGSDFATMGNDTNFMPYYRHDPQYQYVVNFNWTHGRHNVRFGTDIYRQGLNQTQAEWIGGGTFYGSQGGFDFGQQITGLCQDPPDCTTSSKTNRANTYGAFLLGLPDQASKSLQFPDAYHIRSMLYSAYIRDRYNLTPHLTVAYGIRWEYFPYPTRTDRGLERYDPTINKVLICGMGQVPAGCVPTRSVRQLGFIDINAGQIPFTNRTTQPLLQQWGRTAATTFLEPLGTGHYDSLQASLRRRFSKGLMLNVNYTWGKSINFVDSSSSTPNIQSQSYMKMNRAPTGFDITHNIAVTSIWDLPFGRGQKWLGGKGALTFVVSGWQVNNLMSIFGGTPFTVWGDCGAAWPGNSPPMSNSFGKPKKIGSTSGFWYDPFAFGETYDPNNPGSCLRGSLGNNGFNNLRGPGVFNWDFGLFRDFAVKEPLYIQFRAEAFNFTNTPHFCTNALDYYLGDAGAYDPTTGRVTDPGTFMQLNGGINGNSDLAREGIDERQFRLGLRFQW